MKYVCAMWELRARGRKKLSEALRNLERKSSEAESRKEATTTQNDDASWTIKLRPLPALWSLFKDTNRVPLDYWVSCIFPTSSV